MDLLTVSRRKCTTHASPNRWVTYTIIFYNSTYHAIGFSLGPYVLQLYVEKWKLDVALFGITGMLLSAIDLFSTVPMGMIMDGLVLRFGHKRIFAIGSLLAWVAYYGIFHPPIQLTRVQAGHSSLETAAAFSNTSCSSLRSNLLMLVQSNASHSQEEHNYPPVNPNSTLLALWMFTFRLMSFSICNNLISLSMPSLVYTLASTTSKRIEFYATDSLALSVVTLSAGFGGAYVAYTSGSDIQRQVDLLFRCTVAVHFVALMLIGLTTIPPIGKDTTQTTENGGHVVSTARCLMRLMPFRQLLCISLSSHFCLILRNVTMLVAIKSILKMENAQLALSLLRNLMLLANLAIAPIIPHLQRKLGIQAMVTFPQLLAVVTQICFYSFPQILSLAAMDVAGEIALKITGIGLKVMTLQVVDYDALVNAVQSRAGVVSAMAGSIQQAVNSLLDALPLALMGALGYVNNGGCECGCGVSCSQPFLRWDCSRDHGYACTHELTDSNPPFFGDPGRLPPCTWQPPAVVNFVYWSNVVVGPLFALVAIWILGQFTLARLHGEVVEMRKVAEDGGPVFDPVTGSILDGRLRMRPAVVDAFSESDLQRILEGTLAQTLLVRLVLGSAVCLFALVPLFALSLDSVTKILGIALFMGALGYVSFAAVQARLLRDEVRTLLNYVSREYLVPDKAAFSSCSTVMRQTTLVRLRRWHEHSKEGAVPIRRRV